MQKPRLYPPVVSCASRAYDCPFFDDPGGTAVISESEFNERVDNTFEAIELSLDEVDSDLDYEAGGGVLTVNFENGTTMVFSRQPPVRQLWLAARSGGFHFEYDDEAGDWCNTRDGQLLRPFVIAQMKEQGEIDFKWT